MSRKKVLLHNGEKLYLGISLYENNRLAIWADTKDEAYCDITINLPGVMINDSSCIFVDKTCEEDGLLKLLEKEGLLRLTKRKVRSGFSEYFEAKVNMQKLRSFCGEEMNCVLKILDSHTYVHKM